MKKVVIVNHYNLNNGDKAVLEATVFLLEKMYNEIDITVSSFQPSIMKSERYRNIDWGINPNSLIKNLIFKIILKTKVHKYFRYFYKVIANKKYISSIKNADYILVSGGHHLTDILGDELFYILSANMLIPIYMNKRIYLLPQTIGGLKKESSLKSYIITNIINSSSKVAIRDNNSLEFLNNYMIDNKKVYTVPDMVYGLYSDKEIINKNGYIKKIGIALYGNYTGYDAKKRLDRYIINLVQAVEYLCNKGFEINFLPMEVKDTNSDDRILAKRIISMVKLKNNIKILEPKSNDIRDTINNFNEQDIIIAYKTHSVIFSLLRNIPVIAIAYHKKSIDFMKEFGLEKYAFMDEDATTEKIIEAFNNILVNYETIRLTEKSHSKKYFESVKLFFEEIMNEQ